METDGIAKVAEQQENKKIMGITTIRAQQKTVEKLKKFRLIDQEPLDTVLQRLMNAVDPKLLIRGIKNELKQRP